MRDKVVTLFHNLGEDENGRAQWQRTVIRKVSAFRKNGIRQNAAQNLQSIDNMIVYIHAGVSEADRIFLDDTDYHALTDDERERFYAIAADGMDRIVLGESDADTPGEADGNKTRRIVTVQYNDSSQLKCIQNIRLICE